MTRQLCAKINTVLKTTYPQKLIRPMSMMADKLPDGAIVPVADIALRMGKIFSGSGNGLHSNRARSGSQLRFFEEKFPKKFPAVHIRFRKSMKLRFVEEKLGFFESRCFLQDGVQYCMEVFA